MFDVDVVLHHDDVASLARGTASSPHDNGDGVVYRVKRLDSRRDEKHQDFGSCVG